MILDLLNRPTSKPEPLLPTVPAWVYRKGIINKRYPQGPHQSVREKERRLMQLVTSGHGRERFDWHDLPLAITAGKHIVERRHAESFKETA